MKKIIMASIATVMLAIPSVSFASESYFDDLERDQRRTLAKMTMALMKDAKKMGIRLDRKALPAFIVDQNDADGDGVLNEKEFTRAETRLRRAVEGG